MPIEVVTVTINPHAGRLAIVDHGDDTGSKHYESRLEGVNRALEATIQEVQDIKLYKTAAKQLYRSQAERKAGASTAKRVLIGAEISRLIVKHETQQEMTLSEVKAHDTLDQVLTNDAQELHSQLASINIQRRQEMKIASGKDHKSSEYQRKELIKLSEKRRALAKQKPVSAAIDSLNQAQKGRTVNECVDWALQSARFHEQNLQHELFSLDNALQRDLQKDPNTSSSDEGEDSQSRRQHNKQQGKKAKPRQQTADGLSNSNHGTEDVAAKLERELSQLDKTLHRDLIRRRNQNRPTSKSGTPSTKNKLNPLAAHRRHGLFGIVEGGSSIITGFDSNETDELAQIPTQRKQVTLKVAHTVHDESLSKLKQKKSKFEAALRTQVIQHASSADDEDANNTTKHQVVKEAMFPSAPTSRVHTSTSPGSNKRNLQSSDVRRRMLTAASTAPPSTKGSPPSTSQQKPSRPAGPPPSSSIGNNSNKTASRGRTIVDNSTIHHSSNDSHQQSFADDFSHASSSATSFAAGRSTIQQQLAFSQDRGREDLVMVRPGLGTVSNIEGGAQSIDFQQVEWLNQSSSSLQMSPMVQEAASVAAVKPLDQAARDRAHRLAIVASTIDRAVLPPKSRQRRFGQRRTPDNDDYEKEEVQQAGQGFDPFGTHTHRAASTMQYFVSPIDTIMSTAIVERDTNSAGWKEQDAVPYRDREVVAAAKKARDKADRVEGHGLTSNQIVDIFKDKEEGRHLVQDIANVGQTRPALLLAKRIRKAVDADMSVVREVCTEVSARSVETASRLGGQCVGSGETAERKRGLAAQTLRDKEFLRPMLQQKRRTEVMTLDNEQRQLMDATIKPEHMRMLKPKNDAPTDANALPGGEKTSHTFVTQPPSLSLAAIKAASRESERRSPPSPGQRKPGSPPGTASSGKSRLEQLVAQFQKISIHQRLHDLHLLTHHDYAYCYSYDLQLRSALKNSRDAWDRLGRKRILSRLWFVKLLRKIKRYQRSMSFVTVPASLFIFLGALRRLIQLEVAFDSDKDAVWSLVESTIQPSEFASNLVYSALQFLFDAAKISAEEVYRRLKSRKIDLAPKLLMLVRKERKMKLLRRKLKQAQDARTSRAKHRHRHHMRTQSTEGGGSPRNGGHQLKTLREDAEDLDSEAGDDDHPSPIRIMHAPPQLIASPLTAFKNRFGSFTDEDNESNLSSASTESMSMSRQSSLLLNGQQDLSDDSVDSLSLADAIARGDMLEEDIDLDAIDIESVLREI